MSYCIVQCPGRLPSASLGADADSANQASMKTACFQQVRAGSVMAVPRYCRQGARPGLSLRSCFRPSLARRARSPGVPSRPCGRDCVLGVGGQADRSVGRRMARHPGCLLPGGSASPSLPATIAPAVGARENPRAVRAATSYWPYASAAWAAARRKGTCPARRPWSWRVQRPQLRGGALFGRSVGYPGGDRARGVQCVGLGAGQGLASVAPALVGRDLPGADPSRLVALWCISAPYGPLLPAPE